MRGMRGMRGMVDRSPRRVAGLDQRRSDPLLGAYESEFQESDRPDPKGM